MWLRCPVWTGFKAWVRFGLSRTDELTVDISRDGIPVDISRGGITVDISMDGTTEYLKYPWDSPRIYVRISDGKPGQCCDPFPFAHLLQGAGFSAAVQTKKKTTLDHSRGIKK